MTMIEILICAVSAGYCAMSLRHFFAKKSIYWSLRVFSRLLHLPLIKIINSIDWHNISKPACIYVSNLLFRLLDPVLSYNWEVTRLSNSGHPQLQSKFVRQMQYTQKGLVHRHRLQHLHRHLTIQTHQQIRERVVFLILLQSWFHDLPDSSFQLFYIEFSGSLNDL